jgi:putative endonuclease
MEIPKRAKDYLRLRTRFALRRLVGRFGEHLASRHLLQRGYSILGRNVRVQGGEIDLIAFSRDSLIFVEVKTRIITGPNRDPFDSITASKQDQIVRLARWYQAANRKKLKRLRLRHVRFDSLGITITPQRRLLGWVKLLHKEASFN